MAKKDEMKTIGRTRSSDYSEPSLSGIFVEDQTLGTANDQTWIDVIHSMDNIYADLVRYQVALEEKNEELVATQNFIDSVISSMSDVLIVCDNEGRIQSVNRALCEVTGFDEQSLVHMSITDLLSEASAATFHDERRRFLHNELNDVEADFKTKSGESVCLAITSSIRCDNSNLTSGYVITGRPLGELRKAYSALHRAHEDLKMAQQQLVQSEKLASLGRLVAGVAHELNNPISFVYANMHSLTGYRSRILEIIDANKASLDTNAGRELDEIMDELASIAEGSLEGAERVTAIIKNLLKYSTPQQEHLEEFDIVKVTRRAFSWVIKGANRPPRATLNMPQQLSIYNYPGYVHQILVNLFQNAIDALALNPDPAIEINLSVDSSEVVISIADNGEGIDEANLVKLFDPFFTTKDVGTGTGLGLYISYQLATDQCKGTLSADNNPSGGARFTLSLPYEVSR